MNRFLFWPGLDRVSGGVLVWLFLSAWPAAAAEEPGGPTPVQRFFRVLGSVESRITGLDAGGFITWTNVPVAGSFVLQSRAVLGEGGGWVDFLRVPVAGPVTRVQVVAPDAPRNMSFIPAGPFEMGDSFNEGEAHERPVHTVQVSAFYMERYEVWNALWREVYAWAVTNGYSFDNLGSSPEYYDHGALHPVQGINWWDAVKWCNARSERAGRTPVYHTNATLSGVYRGGQLSLNNDWVNWSASGYRLPTEAEWEKAARGGLSGRRFPWGDTIGHTLANYWSGNGIDYDISATRGYHPDYWDKGFPYTNPVGLLGENGYGLFNMAGNVYEWCWDQHSGVGYDAGPVTDPRGINVGSNIRRLRGGMWYSGVGSARCSHRSYDGANTPSTYTGFRCAISAP